MPATFKQPGYEAIKQRDARDVHVATLPANLHFPFHVELEWDSHGKSSGSAMQSTKVLRRAHPGNWKMKVKNIFRASRGLIDATRLYALPSAVAVPLQNSWRRPCLVGSDTGEGKLFPCHHLQPMLTWFVRSTFRPGDKLNVTCPDPSSSPCEGSGSETSNTINIPLLKCLVIDYLCSAATVRLNPHCSVQVVYTFIESQSWTDNKPWIQIDFSPTPYNWARST